MDSTELNQYGQRKTKLSRAQRADQILYAEFRDAITTNPSPEFDFDKLWFSFCDFLSFADEKEIAERFEEWATPENLPEGVL